MHLTPKKSDGVILLSPSIKFGLLLFLIISQTASRLAVVIKFPIDDIDAWAAHIVSKGCQSSGIPVPLYAPSQEG